MNLTEKPPGLWVGLSLPDGRVALANGEDPADATIVAAIRARDFPAVAAWMDEREPLPDGRLFGLQRQDSVRVMLHFFRLEVFDLPGLMFHGLVRRHGRNRGQREAKSKGENYVAHLCLS